MSSTPTQSTNTPLVPKLNPTKSSSQFPTLIPPYTNTKTIYCLVRTYKEHALELNNAIPEKPIIFLKPPASLIMEHDIGQNVIEIPTHLCTNLHHEVELGVIIGQQGKNISISHANEYISGYFLGLDMTAREIQGEAKKKGLPWAVSKGYDTFAPISPPIDTKLIQDNSKLRLQLQVNGVEKQNCTTDQLLFDIPTLISFLSTQFTLQPGDLIFTGTPAGVGPVVPGDVITCQLSNSVDNQLITTMSFPVGKRVETPLYTARL